MPQAGLSVGVVFGGRSVEHDVSIITGIQACEALSARHRPVPIYIDRHGRWFTGDALRQVETYRTDTLAATPIVLDLSTGLLRPTAASTAAAAEPRRRGVFGGRGGSDAAAGSQGDATADVRLDVVIVACHGTQGEDGALQGALELADIPYGGPSLESAVLAMNKAITKAVLRSAGVPVVEDLVVRRDRYESEGGQAIVAQVRARFGLPVFVKPASLGSSVGVTRCADEVQLADALQLAFELDRVALIEPAVEGGMEINCAVLGRPGDQPRVSACERPLATGELLSFEDKYLRDDGGKGGADKTSAGPTGGGAKNAGMAATHRELPAKLTEEQTAGVQDLARRTFTALGATGVTRVDLLVDDQGRLFVNEPNTIPGSFAFYLFEAAGLPFPDLMDELIDIALAEQAEKQRTTRTFESNLLALRGQGGAKT